MAEEYNNDNPLTMKKLAVRMDSFEEFMNENLQQKPVFNPKDSEGILKELRKIAEAEEEANRRRRSMHATHITRIVFEFIAVIAICAFAVGCTGDIPGFIIGGETVKPGDVVIPEVSLPIDPENPETPVEPDNGGTPDVTVPDTEKGVLKGTMWECRPVLAEGMEIVRIEFDAELDEGKVFFTSRGREKSRVFEVANGNLVFRSPESIWTYTTDYRSNFAVVTGDGIEIVFTRLNM